MKITKRQLRSIIREAVVRHSEEYQKGYKTGRDGSEPCPMMSHNEDYMQGYEAGIEDWQKPQMEPEEIHPDVSGIRWQGYAGVTW